MPGNGELGPNVSPQQLVASCPSDSSARISNKPSFPNAGDASIFGTYVDRKWSTDVRPPAFDPVASLPVHGASWPSSQRFGTMNDNCGVVDAYARSWVRCVNGR